MGEMVQDGVTGFLVDPGDVAGLAWAITRFFREDRAETFRHNLQLRPDRSGWNKIVEAVLNFD
jgi:glycosyltransferase involved in cell wall biosynthesis